MSPRQSFTTNSQVTLTVAVPPSTPYNLQPNENGGMGGYGYVTELIGTRVERDAGLTSLRFVVNNDVGENYFETEAFGVTPGHYVAAQVRALTGQAAVQLEWLAADGTATPASTSSYATGVRTAPATVVPAGTTSARLRIHVLDADGTSVPYAVAYFRFDQVRVATAPTAGAINLAALTPYDTVTVSGSARELKLDRSPLSLGTLDVSILSDALDPAVASTLRQGRACQLFAGGVSIFTGRILEAKTDYDLENPVGKRARITVSAVDAVSTLAQHKRPDGVATIDELPAVLEGCRVPWEINDSTAQIGTYTVVARNESRTAVDQVAVTRDTAQGYAWVNQFGVLVVRDADTMPSSIEATLDEAAYSALDTGFDMATVINELSVMLTRINTGTGETEEVPRGPYRDQASIDEWGPRSPTSPFVVQGLDEAAVDAWAAAVLAANATPRVRVRSVTIPILDTTDIGTFATLDLYDLVKVKHTARGINEDLRITRIEHSITSSKWSLVLGFEDDGQVAQPQATPSLPATGNGLTTAELYRPVGEVTMWFGSVGSIPAGWLRCNGAAFDAGTYPKLAALLGGTNTPDFTDRFPIGVGTKALGTNGGAATVQLTKANIPQHVHGMAHTHAISRGSAVATGGTVARGNATAQPDQDTGQASSTNTGNGSADGLTNNTPVDVMNPWRAVHFIIRAA